MEATLENIDQMQSTMYKSVSSIPWAMRDDWGFDWSSLKPGMDSNDAFEMFKDAVIQIRGDQGSGGYTAQNLANKNDKYYNELLKTYVQKIATMGMSVEGGTGKLVMDQVQDRLPNDTISEASLGKMTGSRKSSYQPLADSVKIIVRHNKEVNEEVRGARSRNIHSILVQRGEEKFKMAENNLSAARAMARHLHNGGEIHDTVGESINSMAKDYKQLREFVRYVKSAKLVNESNQEIVELAIENVNEIRTHFKRLSGVKTYANAVEGIQNFSSVELLTDDIDIEGKFTETHFDDKVANVTSSLKNLISRKKSFESKITKAIESENFADLKENLAEQDIMDFDNPNAKLGHQVSMLGYSAKDETLSNYLQGLSNKISSGGDLNQFEYGTIKSCLLGANSSSQNTAPVDMAEAYEVFLDQYTL